MTDEEKQKLEEEAKAAEKPKDLIMIIKQTPEGKMDVNFPFLGDKLLSYGFLKIAEKILDNFYARTDKEANTPPKGGIRNFVRNMH